MEPELVGRRVPGRGMRYAAVTALAATAVGILVQRVSGPPWWALVLPAAAGVALLRPTRGWSLLLALAGAAGLLALVREPLPVPDDLYEQDRFRGVVVEEPFGDSRRAAVNLEAPLNGKVVLWLDEGVEAMCGDRVEVRARIKRLEFPRNPGVFDRNEYYRRRGFVGEASGSRFTVRKLPGTGGSVVIRALAAPARRFALRALAADLPASESGVMAALLLGARSGLDPETGRAFTDAGVLHVLAVSGLHVGIVIGLLWLVLGMLRLRSRWRVGLALVGVAAYVLVTGARPSAVRAGVMGAVLLLAGVSDRRFDPLAGLGVAGILLLAFDPAALFDTGFQLSFVAAGAIGLVMTRVRDWTWPHPWRTRPGRFLRRWLVYPALVATAASVAAAPLLLHHFGRVQPLGVLATLPVVLLVGWAVPLGFAVVLVHIVSPMLAGLLGASLTLLVQVLLAVVGWFGSQRWAIVEAGNISWLAVGCCYLGLAVAWNWRRPRARTLLLFMLVAGLNVGVWRSALAPGRARAVFLDPGIGDALVLEDRLGRLALVDAGIDGEGVLRDYLRGRGVRRVELAVITHPDRDHYGGMLDLPAGFRVGTALVTTLHGDTAYRRLLDRLAGQGTRLVVGGQGTRVSFGEWTLDFAWPSPVARARFARGLVSTNDMSLVALARRGGFSMLLTGDLDEPRVLAGTGLRAQLLKSPHHGSRQGNPDLLFDMVRPEVVVVMGRYPTPAGLEERLVGGLVRLVNTRRDGAWQLVLGGNRVVEVPYRSPGP